MTTYPSSGPAPRAATTYNDGQRVSAATVACGDLLEVDGERRRVTGIVRTRTGFTVRLDGGGVVRLVWPPEVRRIDGRPVRLDQVPDDRCLWCPSRTGPLIAVGLYTTRAGTQVTVHACAACRHRHHLEPLAHRPSGTTDVRRRTP